jgi:hypothetical protein
MSFCPHPQVRVLVCSDDGDPLRDYLLPLAVIHGLVTVSTPGPVQNTYSTEQLQVQDYWDRIIGTETTVKSFLRISLFSSSVHPYVLSIWRAIS